MANKKTAISIEKPLFEEIEALAEEMEVSRSYSVYTGCPGIYSTP